MQAVGPAQPRPGSPGRGRRWAGRLALAAAGIGAAAGLLQILSVPQGGVAGPFHTGASRQTPYRHIYRRSVDPVLVTELRPGARGVVNDDGFLDDDYALPKPPGVWRVVGLGDSVTMYFAHERQNYLDVLERALSGLRGGPAEVLNFGVGGYDTVQEVRQLETVGLKYAPDFVTLGYVLNDAIDFSALADVAAGSPLGLSDAEDGRDVQVTLLARLGGRRDDALRAEVLGAGAAGKPFAQSVAQLRRLSALARAQGFGVLVVILPVLLPADFDVASGGVEALRDVGGVPRPLGPYGVVRRAVAHEARELGFAVLDVSEALSQHPAREVGANYEADVIHLNAEGNRIVGEAVVAWFRAHKPWAAPPAP